MAKFDVNKIIEESLRETTSKEVISEVEPLQVMKGWYGSKLYDRLHKTPTPEEALGEKRFQIARKYRGAVDSGDTEGARFARQQLKRIHPTAAPEDKEASSLLSQETARDAARDESTPRIRKGLVYGSDEYKKLAAEREIAGTPDAMKKAVEADASVLSHLGKSARKVGDDIQSGVKSFGHKVADHLSNLDYGKTALAGGAIAAGLGALALRRRMKKAQQR